MSFNSRPHKEVDSDTVFSSHFLRIFQLTTSQGGRPVIDGVRQKIKDFQLTTSQGGRPSPFSKYSDDTPLSTHDLTRRSTAVGTLFFQTVGLSTHDLTRRSTATLLIRELPEKLSTHDLTRRSTTWCPIKRTERRDFQLTTSQGGRLPRLHRRNNL